jgi:hypothetical protein
MLRQCPSGRESVERSNALQELKGTTDGMQVFSVYDFINRLTWSVR